jgi:hypothetical protein
LMKNKTCLPLPEILGRMLVVAYFCLGAALVLLSYRVWENKDLIERVAGCTAFLIAAAWFIAQGIRGLMGWRKGH